MIKVTNLIPDNIFKTANIRYSKRGRIKGAFNGPILSK